MSGGFLGRWSRRKQQARDGRVPVDAPPQSDPTPGPAAPEAARMSTAPVSGAMPPAPPESVPEVPLPTLEDVRALTPQSDFRPFLARGVAPEVKNAAVKKLFADPHFNVMDGLDTYIDDYNRPDPLPAAMLRQMASAQFMHLVEPEPTAADAPVGGGAPLREDAGSAEAASVAECHSSVPVADAASASFDTPSSPGSADPAPRPLPAPEDHADPDLRLQPDHAARREGAGPGTA